MLLMSFVLGLVRLFLLLYLVYVFLVVCLRVVSVGCLLLFFWCDCCSWIVCACFVCAR